MAERLAWRGRDEREPFARGSTVPDDRDEVGSDAGGGRRYWLFLSISLPLWAAVALRTVGDVAPVAGPAEWAALGALGAFALLLASERPFADRAGRYRPLYFLLQTGLVLVLFLLLRHPDQDYFALLLLPVTAQAAFAFPPPWRYRWITLFAAAMVAGELYAVGWPDSLPFVLVYASAYAFVASYAAMTEWAEAARGRSRLLLADLREAYRRLERSAAQAEELAALDERTRLARDLHDSAAQTLFGLALSAEAAARALDQGERDAAADRLREVRESARQAMAELRLLVFQLRSPTLARDGLAASLRRRLDAVEGRAGLATSLVVDGEGRLPEEVEAELDRIAQEALNNALKHARARRIAVEWRVDGANAALAVADDGVGFDPIVAGSGGGLGLRGMAERAAGIGATLDVASRPGAGTRVRVEVPR